LRRLFTATITRQLMLGIAIVHAVLMTVFVFDLVARERAFLSEQSEKQALSLAATLAANGASWLLANDVVGMEEVIAAQSGYPGVRYAMFVDRDNKVLAYTDRSKVGQYLSDEVSRLLLDVAAVPQLLIDRVEFSDAAAPIFSNDMHIGWARVGLSRGEIAKNLERVTHDGLVYTVVAILVGSVFAWLMAKGLTTGVRRLATQADRVRQGERDVDFSIDRDDELGHLSDAFGRMVTTLDAREREVATNHALLRSILDASPDLIFFKDGNGVYRGCNDAFAEYIGRSESEIVGRTDCDLLDAETAAFFRDNDRKMLELGQRRNNEEWVTYPDGHRVLMDTMKTPYYGPNDSALGVLGISRDITARYLADQQLRQSQEMLEEAQRIARIGSWDLDLSTNHLTWTREVYRIFELDPDQVSPSYEGFLAAIHPEDRGMVDQAYHDSLRTRRPYKLEHRLQMPDGRIKYVEEQCETSYDTFGKPLRSFGTVQDVTERHLTHAELEQKQQHLDRLAHYDSLTGLPNRVLFRDRLEQALLKSRRRDEQLAVLFIDLDEFKQINDSLGHAVGDLVLQQVARRFLSVVREEDSVARLGGDEFTVILESILSADNVSQVAQKLIHVVQDPLHIDQRELYVTASIGISLYPGDGQDAQTLLRNADTAMFKAKEQGRNAFHFYTEDMTEKAYDRILMETNLRNALRNEEFVLYYQPKLDLGSGAVVGVEALVRWKLPEGGVIAPGRFIPVAEESGLIIPLGAWVLREACRQAREWHEQGLLQGRIAVNLSGKQLYQRDLVEVIRNILSDTGCDPAWVELEVTEGFVMKNPEQSIQLLGELRGMGFELSIDDFGTGYSSLAYLKQLPISKLKIDRSFVSGTPTDVDDVAIARAIIALGRSLALTTIAEGIETDEQRAFMLAEGCDQAQGFFFSHPLPVERVVQFMRMHGTRG
ncbi:MAG: EAL domain-containing protein, partial [Chromatiales bacterium]|nr:EAL domain-containing protein [Chromatiales bacterium]